MKRARDTMKLDKQVVANVGLYWTCYHLSRLGWNVMPTARNARGVDVIAYNRAGTRFVGIQVKTLSKRHAAILGKSRQRLMGDFWVIVNRVATIPTAFVLTPAEVRRHQTRNRDGTCWLNPRAYEADKFREAWDRIGRGDG